MQQDNILAQAKEFVNAFRKTHSLRIPAMRFYEFQIFMTEVNFLLGTNPVGENR
ncbi:succinate dehydrogenase flavoprotein subunit [Rosenbergiella collisarenosi]|uniref:succinate dehydrogenase flavoprotein subunit n=1 Tax=Rosenbergiella collisarenosi TaxID=1544695 RepID=UPI001F4DFE34|nr:succinate dehydrogenase flavoprotein subunit [Rosenbergiella collisarenosi]